MNFGVITKNPERTPKAARRRYPEGSRAQGIIKQSPWRPGVVGLLVDIQSKDVGFGDVLLLPHDPADRPPPGTTAEFDVLQHRPGQIRLWPIADQLRGSDAPREALGSQCQVTVTVTVTVTRALVERRPKLMSRPIRPSPHDRRRSWTPWRRETTRPGSAQRVGVYERGSAG
jgi:hypothetical protein